MATAAVVVDLEGVIIMVVTEEAVTTEEVVTEEGIEVEEAAAAQVDTVAEAAQVAQEEVRYSSLFSHSASLAIILSVLS